MGEQRVEGGEALIASPTCAGPEVEYHFSSSWTLRVTGLLICMRGGDF